MKSTNRKILAITGMFGGQQAVNILCSIVRTKLVALWIGPAGIGLFGIFNSAVETFGGLSQLNLRQTAVREISAAKGDSLGVIARSVRRIALWLGLAGALLMLCLSPWLAEASLGNRSGWISYAWLAVTIALIAINNGEAAIFQGLRQFKRLTVCLMAGSIGGLIISVPLFYVWRIDSIVPSIVAFYVVTWLFLGLYRLKLPSIGRSVSTAESLSVGRRFIRLGIYLTISELAVSSINYITLAYLNRFAGIDSAGIFSAGSTLINRYAGMVFVAIAMEYFPRLSAVAGMPLRESAFVSNQAVISIAIIAPLATTFIALLYPIVSVLYTDAFYDAVPMAAFAMTGTVVRAVSWCMAYVIVARGDGPTFLVVEVLSSVIALALNIAGFHIAGFAGMGIAYSIWYMLYTGIVAYVYFGRYALRLNRRVWAWLLYAVAVACSSAIIAIYISFWYCIPFMLLTWVVAWRSIRSRKGNAELTGRTRC